MSPCACWVLRFAERRDIKIRARVNHSFRSIRDDQLESGNRHAADGRWKPRGLPRLDGHRTEEVEQTGGWGPILTLTL